MSRNKANNHIAPLFINGLNGRMLRLPPPKNRNREILLLYGHHASIERMFGFAEVLNRYGAVTLPDLPGFGGMESFYKINEKPTLDTLADYVASIIKLRYNRRRLTIVTFSFSCPIVVRMLQKYPEIEAKVDILVSTVGFVHHDDFKFSTVNYWLLRTLSSVGSHKIPSFLMRKILIRAPLIRAFYQSVSGSHSKLFDADETETKKRIDFEVSLWQMNDIRTRMFTLNLMLKLDLCNIPLPTKAYHVAPDFDRYFDNTIVEQHMRVIFDKLEIVPTSMPAHAPSIIASAKDAAPYVPKRLRQVLNK